MKIQLLSEHIGAEISGIQLDNLNENAVAEIKEAWLEFTPSQITSKITLKLSS
jgi:alpha-ketoglutarate-dependent taurine dioxygenase